MHYHKVTIIVVAHNQRPFIEQALASIESQTIGLENIEIILVNDSSNDGTEMIFSSFLKEHPENVKTATVNFHNVGQTRNTSLSMVTSPYLMFLDGDDVLANDACEVLLNVANQQPDCMVISPLNQFKQKEQIITRQNRPDQSQVEHIDARNLFLLFLTGEKYNGQMIGTLFCSSLFQDIRFPQFICYEDSHIAPDLIFRAQNLYLVNLPLYNYRKSMNSTSSSLNNEKALCRLKTLNKVKTFVTDDRERRYYNESCIKQCQIIIDHVTDLDKQSKKLIKEIILGISLWPFMLNPRNRLSRKKILWQKRKEVLNWT